MDIENLIDNLVSPFAAGFIAVARLEMPGATDAEITAKAEGDLKHFLRSKIAWGVDVIWGVPQFRSLLDKDMAETLAAGKPAPASQESALPLGQAAGGLTP